MSIVVAVVLVSLMEHNFDKKLMFLIDTDLLHDYFGLNAYKNNKRSVERKGGKGIQIISFLAKYWKKNPRQHRDCLLF